jgi:hypothetical protein
MSSSSTPRSHSRPVRERNALLDGKLVKVILLSDLDGTLAFNTLFLNSLIHVADDINPLQPDDITVDWDAWSHISPEDISQEDLDEVTDSLKGLNLSSNESSSPWMWDVFTDPLVAAEERALRLGPFSKIKASSSRRAAYVVYFGRRMGVFITW